MQINEFSEIIPCPFPVLPSSSFLFSRSLAVGCCSRSLSMQKFRLVWNFSLWHWGSGLCRSSADSLFDFSIGKCCSTLWKQQRGGIKLETWRGLPLFLFWSSGGPPSSLSSCTGACCTARFKACEMQAGVSLLGCFCFPDGTRAG